jgi:hypothetical protein
VKLATRAIAILVILTGCRCHGLESSNAAGALRATCATIVEGDRYATSTADRQRSLLGDDTADEPGATWLDEDNAGTPLSSMDNFRSNPRTSGLIGSRTVSLASERPLKSILQCRPIERLGEIRYGPLLHDLIMYAADRERRDEDYWYFCTDLQQMLLELWAAHPAHLHVSDQTLGLFQRPRAQKCFTGLKGLDVIPKRLHQPARCRANIIVVVYN